MSMKVKLYMTKLKYLSFVMRCKVKKRLYNELLLVLRRAFEVQLQTRFLSSNPFNVKYSGTSEATLSEKKKHDHTHTAHVVLKANMQSGLSSVVRLSRYT